MKITPSAVPTIPNANPAVPIPARLVVPLLRAILLVTIAAIDDNIKIGVPNKAIQQNIVPSIPVTKEIIERILAGVE